MINEYQPSRSSHKVSWHESVMGRSIVSSYHPTRGSDLIPDIPTPWKAGYVPDCLPIYVSEVPTSTMLVCDGLNCLFQHSISPGCASYLFGTVNDTLFRVQKVFQDLSRLHHLPDHQNDDPGAIHPSRDWAVYHPCSNLLPMADRGTIQLAA